MRPEFGVAVCVIIVATSGPDSGREDVAYENRHGHKLDRKRSHSYNTTDHGGLLIRGTKAALRIIPGRRARMEYLNMLLGIGAEARDLNSLQVSLRAIVVFLSAIAMVRLGDKRFLSRKTAFDAVVGFVLASTLARAVAVAYVERNGEISVVKS
jgi:hypothetical protein